MHLKTCIIILLGLIALYLPGNSLFQKEKNESPIIEDKTVAQVAILVKDIEESGKLWADVLGVDPPKAAVSTSHPDRPTTFHGEVTHAEAKLAFIKMGNIELELIEPMGEGSTWQEFLDTHGEGIHHIAFWVKDIEGISKKLSLKGIPTVQTGGWDTGGYSYLDARETLGCIVELLESFE
jgi:methylmalonyl-CoA/ethylmalonyl-CoA epimerase